MSSHFLRNSLPTREEALLAVARRKARERDMTDLGAFIPRISPEFERPEHFQPFCNLFDRIARGESVFALVEAPPRHGKSETVFHGIARLIRYGGKRCAYATYSNQFAHRKSRRIRELVQTAGGFAGNQEKERAGGFAASQAVSFWESDNCGSLIAGGRGGGYKGEGFDFIAIDDPYKNRAEYESPVVRESVRELWTGTLRDRVEPGGSVIIFHQRWGIDDLIATIKENDAGRNRWDVITMPAVEGYEEDSMGNIIKGHPLWGERYGIPELQAIKDDVGDYNWWSQFMQKPRVRGERIFEDPHFYRELPSVYKTAFGIDLAYSEGTQNDFSVIIRGVASGGMLYITDVCRMKKTTITVTGAIARFADDNPGAPFRWYTGGQEKAIAATLRRDTGAYIKPYPAKNDKFIRASPVARAWNKGKVLLPAGAPWLPAFLSEVSSFTGTKADSHDDIVDALAALFDELMTSSPWDGVL